MALPKDTSLRWMRFAVLVLLAAILQQNVVKVIAVTATAVKPDLLLILLVFFATHAGPKNAVATSFAIGFVADLIGPMMGVMGPRILSFGLVGTVLSDLDRVLIIRRPVHQGLAIFVCGLLAGLLAYLLTLLRARPSGFRIAAELLWQPLYSAVLGPVLFLPVAWWMRIRTGMKRRSPE